MAGRYDEPPERNSVEGSSGTSVGIVTASQIVHSRLPGTAIRREQTAQGRKRCRLVIVRTVAFVRRARRASLRASLRVTAASTLPSTHRVVRPSSRPRHGAERHGISAERASPDRRARPHPMESRLASPVVGRRDDLEPDGCAGWEQVHRVDAVPPLPGQQVHRPVARAGEEAQAAVLDDVRSARQGRRGQLGPETNSASATSRFG